VVKKHASIGKMTVLFNFPNNPTGYSITPAEADGIRDILVEAAAKQECDVVAICDDAYFGLFYDEEVLRESLFTRLAAAHPRILAIKLDGASKEDYAWGLRVGFLSYGVSGGSGAYEALEKKTGGCIRGTISNSPNLSQSLVLKAMNDPNYRAEKAQKHAILARRAAIVQNLLAEPRFAEVWTMYPFNSGYFMCVRLNDLNAEEYRVKLLNDYGVGVISNNATDIRVAISCVDEADLPDLFDVMLACALEMKK
jgi:aspartate/methionine/tyrosine aminotransferase